MLRHSRERTALIITCISLCEHTVTESLSQVMKAGTLRRILVRPGEFCTRPPSDTHSHVGIVTHTRTSTHQSQKRALAARVYTCHFLFFGEKQSFYSPVWSWMWPRGRVSTVLITGLAVLEDQLFYFFSPRCFPGDFALIWFESSSEHSRSLHNLV